MYLFGSYARGTATEESDIDLLVDTTGTSLRTLVTLGGLYKDTHYQQSIAFSIIQIAELSGGLSAAYKTDTSDRIPWARMKAMGNIVVHDYGNVDHNIVWETANLDIPALRRFCEEQLAAADEGEN